MVPDLGGEVAGYQDRAGNARRRYQVELPGENGLPPDIEETLGCVIGERAEPGAVSGREDDGAEVREKPGQNLMPG